MAFFIKEFYTTTHTRMLIFDMQIDGDLFYYTPVLKKMGGGGYTGLHLSVLPFIRPFHPFPFWRKFFVKDLSTTMQARMLIFGMQVDGDLLYRGIENQPSPAHLSLYYYTPALKKWGGILVYICLSIRPSVRPSLPSFPFLLKMFRQRSLNNHTSQNAHIWCAGW